MKQARNYLEELYLDWINNYITIDKFAEHNGITHEQATKLIVLMQSIYNSNHPES